jgi:hypothetical protein
MKYEKSPRSVNKLIFASSLPTQVDERPILRQQ